MGGVTSTGGFRRASVSWETTENEKHTEVYIEKRTRS